MAKMKSNGIKTFVVSDSDRFSRSILTAEIMKQDCREHGISAFDASTGMDLAISKNENPEIALINNLLQAISEYDKLKTVQRLQSGRRRAKKMGKSIGGQTKVGETEEEKKMLERLVHWRNRAVHGRLSVQEIADRLNEEGFRTRRNTALTRQVLDSYIKRGVKLRHPALLILEKQQLQSRLSFRTSNNLFHYSYLDSPLCGENSQACELLFLRKE